MLQDLKNLGYHVDQHDASVKLLTAMPPRIIEMA